MSKSWMDVQALQRAIDILEMIADSPVPVNLRQITSATNLPRATVYRLLGNWEKRNYITCDNKGNYHIGHKVLTLGRHRMKQATELKPVIKPYLAKISSITKESVHLAVLHQNKILYIDSVESPYPLRLVGQVGAFNHVHCTALGKALLFQHSEETINAMLTAEGMKKITAATITDFDAYAENIRKAKILGYTLDLKESDEVCNCIAAPIYNAAGQIIAAISISGPYPRVNQEILEQDFSPLLLAMTREISAIMGYTPGTP